jgi:hypothetical protein
MSSELQYSVTLKDRDFEVREYPALVNAEVTVSGDRRQAANDGFRILAAYILGHNRRHETLPMTTPVVQAQLPAESTGESTSESTSEATPTEDAGRWTVRFVMPRTTNIDTLPTPDDMRVRLRHVPPSRVAVLRFSGLAHEPDIEQRTLDLSTFVSDHNLQPKGPAILAQYSPPWTPWFMRRNEVMIPLASGSVH